MRHWSIVILLAGTGKIPLRVNSLNVQYNTPFADTQQNATPYGGWGSNLQKKVLSNI